MSEALALKEKETSFAVVADNDNEALYHKGRMTLEARRTLAQMIATCDDNNLAAYCLARGIVVVDTMQDIGTQLQNYFPAIDLAPIMDDVSFFVAEQAEKNNQRYQEVMLKYVTDGKSPEIDEANKDVSFKVYTPNGTTFSKGTGFEDKKAELKKDGGGGSGGTGEQLTKITQAGYKKFFLLTSATLDITDTRVQNLGIVQAFGGAPAALEAVTTIIAAGGEPAKQVQTAIDAIVEVKTLQADLLANAQNDVAPAIAAALAIKTETLAAQLPQLQTILPPIAMKEATRPVDSVKTDMAAQQMAFAIEIMSGATLPLDNIVTANVAKAVEAVQQSIAGSDVSLREAIALVMTRTAPDAIAQPMAQLTGLLTQPHTLPAVERSLSIPAAEALRTSLIAPPLQLAGETPMPWSPVKNRMQDMAQQYPILNETIAKFEQIMPKPYEPALVRPTMDLARIVENLKAMQMTQAADSGLKIKLRGLIPLIESLGVQSRAPVTQSSPDTFIKTSLAELKDSALTIKNSTAKLAIAQMTVMLETNPTLQTAENISGNLKAMLLSESVPVEVKQEIAALLSRLQQSAKSLPKDKDGIYDDIYGDKKKGPIVTSPYAPLSLLEDSSGRPAPKLSHSPWEGYHGYADGIQYGYRGSQEFSPWGPQKNWNNDSSGAANTMSAAKNDNKVTERGCGGKTCSNCFTRACQAVSQTTAANINAASTEAIPVFDMPRVA